MQSSHAITRIPVRIVSAFVFVCLLTTTANAYTVIMRGGRRVEIPSSFVMTTSTLTYEVSPGVQITLNVAAIDIPATETANNESPGSLLRRAQLALGESRARAEADLSGQPARHTITNRDLEPSMRRRRESELAYERRRKELGLPTVEESRRQAAAESDAIAMELAQTRASENATEGYWRARASALRTEIDAVNAQLTYIRRQLDEPAFPPPDGSFLSDLGLVQFRPIACFPGSSPRPVQHRPGIFVAPRSGALVTGRVAFGAGPPRGQVLLNPWGFPRSRRLGSPLIAPPNVSVLGSILPNYGISDERNQLIRQFNELGVARAGLNERWRQLEDEARRAGAPPGWLRP